MGADFVGAHFARLCGRATSGLLCLLAALFVAGRADAQDFVNQTYISRSCADSSFTNDPVTDSTGGDYKNIVGDSTHPGLYYAEDTNYGYFRMRLVGSPLSAASCSTMADVVPFGWGVLFDYDGDVTAYEAGIFIDGTGNSANKGVKLGYLSRANATNSPSDPSTSYKVYSDGTNGNATACSLIDVRSATDTSGTSPTWYGTDVFLTIAVPKTDLLNAIKQIYPTATAPLTPAKAAAVSPVSLTLSARLRPL